MEAVIMKWSCLNYKLLCTCLMFKQIVKCLAAGLVVTVSCCDLLWYALNHVLSYCPAVPKIVQQFISIYGRIYLALMP